MNKRELLRELKIAVANKIDDLQNESEMVFGSRVPNLQIKYNLHSVTTAGRARTNHYHSIYNVELHEAALLEYKEEYINEVIPHEFAHLIANCLYPSIKPHGREWKRVMTFLGESPDRCHNMDLRKAIENNIDLIGKSVRKKRQVKRYNYSCGCRNHMITAVRHNKIIKGKTEYSCRGCGETIVAV